MAKKRKRKRCYTVTHERYGHDKEQKQECEELSERLEIGTRKTVKAYEKGKIDGIKRSLAGRIDISFREVGAITFKKGFGYRANFVQLYDDMSINEVSGFDEIEKTFFYKIGKKQAKVRISVKMKNLDDEADDKTPELIVIRIAEHASKQTASLL